MDDTIARLLGAQECDRVLTRMYNGFCFLAESSSSDHAASLHQKIDQRVTLVQRHAISARQPGSKDVDIRNRKSAQSI